MARGALQHRRPGPPQQRQAEASSARHTRRNIRFNCCNIPSPHRRRARNAGKDGATLGWREPGAALAVVRAVWETEEQQQSEHEEERREGGGRGGREGGEGGGRGVHV
jgi:hypothetical protein